jgi:hypothetical protein
MPLHKPVPRRLRVDADASACLRAVASEKVVEIGGDILYVDLAHWSTFSVFRFDRIFVGVGGLRIALQRVAATHGRYAEGPAMQALRPSSRAGRGAHGHRR